MRAIEPRRRDRGGLLLPSLAALAAFAILVGLGAWQLQRKAWKDHLVATLTERFAAPPAPLPDPAQWPALDRDQFEFVRVRVPAEFLHDREALVYSAGSTLRAGAPTGPGFLVFTPARRSDGSLVLVNRGFVPQALADPASRAAGQTPGAVEIVGVIRWPDPPSIFAPAPDPGRNLWFARDPAAIAAAKGLAAAPFYIEQEAPTPAGGWPQPAHLQPTLTNNHLQYTITWWGLAAALLAVYGAWVMRRNRSPAV